MNLPDTARRSAALTYASTPVAGLSDPDRSDTRAESGPAPGLGKPSAPDAVRPSRAARGRLAGRTGTAGITGSHPARGPRVAVLVLTFRRPSCPPRFPHRPVLAGQWADIPDMYLRWTLNGPAAGTSALAITLGSRRRIGPELTGLDQSAGTGRAASAPTSDRRASRERARPGNRYKPGA